VSCLLCDAVRAMVKGGLNAVVLGFCGFAFFFFVSGFFFFFFFLLLPFFFLFEDVPVARFLRCRAGRHSEARLSETRRQVSLSGLCVASRHLVQGERFAALHLHQDCDRLGRHLGVGRRRLHCRRKARGRQRASHAHLHQPHH
jgi:hypothetical protein